MVYGLQVGAEEGVDYSTWLLGANGRVHALRSGKASTGSYFRADEEVDQEEDGGPERPRHYFRRIYHGQKQARLSQ